MVLVKYLSEKHHTIDGRDTLSFNQLRFQCAHSALYTSKVMYDRFGKWNKEILPRNRKHPILVWENVDLLSNGRKYNVMTDGLEEYKNIYASVMVFDNDGKDILSGSSTEKVTIAGFFADLIKNNDDGKEGFYEVYWESVDPKRWKMMQRHRNM